MKGDFSRFTFNRNNNYISVLKQQGRIELDSDWNEQAEIIGETIRQLTADILGPFAVPLPSDDLNGDNSRALMISDYSRGPGGVIDFTIGSGLAYLGGYPFRLAKNASYLAQPDYPEPEIPPDDGDLLVFMEIWQRAISYIDDDLIREPAMGGPDTCLRTKLAGQIKVMAARGVENPHDACRFLSASFSRCGILLTLQVDQSAQQIPISFGEIEVAGGFIPGNLHYRLELHRDISNEPGISEGVKWSDENGAVVVRALKAIDNRQILIEELEQITGESLKPGDWVEVSNLLTELKRQGGQIAQILTLESVSGGLLATLDRDIHPLLTRRKNGARSGLDQGLAPRLRRWSGYISPLSFKSVFDLGRGIKAIFHSSDKDYLFEPGDYWTFAIRDREYNKRYAPQKAPPQGVRKFRHPLAIIKRSGGKQTGRIIDCRRFFHPLSDFGPG